MTSCRYWSQQGTGEAGRIAVLFVDGHSVFLQEVVEELHALSVLVVILRIHADDGMEAFASAVNERRDRQFQLAEDDILFRNG